MDKIRIALLEKIGWKDLSRELRLGNSNALRGTSPDGKKNKIAPNPVKSLDSLHALVGILSTGKYCGSILEKYENAIYDGGLALAGAEERAKQLYYVLYPDPED